MEKTAAQCLLRGTIPEISVRVLRTLLERANPSILTIPWPLGGCIPLRQTKIAVQPQSEGRGNILIFDEERLSATIFCVSAKCRFGGRRWWFTCPTCIRRCESLFLREDQHQCRICLGMRYRSQTYSRQKNRKLSKHVEADLLRPTLRRLLYRGIPTRKYRRFLKAREEGQGCKCHECMMEVLMNVINPPTGRSIGRRLALCPGSPENAYLVKMAGHV